MSLIEVDNVVKRYRLGQTQTLKNSLARLLGRMPVSASNFNALDGLNFQVEAGEVLGIIGSNGAGKSTLLKVLSGITTPTSGRVATRGRVAPLIEVGAGLIGDLTGRENVFLNGVILGMSISEIKRKFDDIVGFAELDKFIDTPIKRYSSGMAIRLGFSIATAVQADILIVDEVLAVGDIAFQRKCFDRIEEIIKKRGTTVLLVSHNIRQVERLCTRALLLDRGKILADGATPEVCRQFYDRTNVRVRDNALTAATAGAKLSSTRRQDVELVGIDLLDADGRSTNVVPFRSDVTIEVRIHAAKPLHNPIFGVGVHTSDMLYLATAHSDQQLAIKQIAAGEHVLRCTFRRLLLLPGVYSLRFGLSESGNSAPTVYAENLKHFQVVVAGSKENVPADQEGFFALDTEWRLPIKQAEEISVLEAQ